MGKLRLAILGMVVLGLTGTATGTQPLAQGRNGGKKMQTATFGAGCFWGVEEAFRKVPGVLETAVGYMGGKLEKPTYQDVCTDKTGHAEVVQITYDPEKVSYGLLLQMFFDLHDPTTMNRQGPDAGTQYRSVVFFHDEPQQKAAQAMKERLTREKKFDRPIVTQIVPAGTFWKAEEYHQKYLQKHGLSSCHI